jgi:hypothetical protein
VIDDQGGGLQVTTVPVTVVATRSEPRARPVEVATGNGRRWWAASLAVAVLLTAGGLALLYNDDLSFQSADRALTTANESLQGQNLGIQGQLSATEGQLSTAQSDLATVRAELAHPNLGIWNVRQTLQDQTQYLAAGIPDTFTYHLRLTSNGPMNVSILSFDQFATATRCVENGVGPTNYCMHHSGAVSSWLGVAAVNSDFHLAEGCAAYMLVITAPTKVTITPNVSVTYNPASHVTGVC